MNDQLSALELRIDQLLGHFAQVRDENRDLRLRVANLESENRRLQEKIDAAAERVEGLIEGLPAA
ncbi:MAG: hypothetical protein WCF44_03010 [Candidatus Methylophosphatis roskildensis]|jgi:uncharacterized protein (TIGR02449 family)|uniref:Cell division protein ZapB n=1 Tax=Candidatus Methylophosphatis roskildensis TaxID=2899263 RepID=A0A9D7HKP9_9PROT|nr:hypothetical protein [Candidatus Methylophosphatis roskildensis]MBK7238460.1 hypothetical protein [Sterolibacteriaceae bacterium]